jgi:lysophospholipase L1-like esterase
MTIRWARENISKWLTTMNPEAAVIMFGSNDVGQMDVGEYEKTTVEVIDACLANGTIVILTTAPPQTAHLEKCREFAAAIRRTASKRHLPLIDFASEIERRRPDDWDGSGSKFKEVPGDTYEVPTLISRDGVHPSNPRAFQNNFSEEALSNNGFTLRNYLTLHKYAEVIRGVLNR